MFLFETEFFEYSLLGQIWFGRVGTPRMNLGAAMRLCVNGHDLFFCNIFLHTFLVEFTCSAQSAIRAPGTC